MVPTWALQQGLELRSGAHLSSLVSILLSKNISPGPRDLGGGESFQFEIYSTFIESHLVCQTLCLGKGQETKLQS